MGMGTNPAPSAAVCNEWVGLTRGTRIRTPLGDRPIEALSPGDPVLLRDGHTARVRQMSCRAPSRQAVDATPVRISASALAPGLPRQDLVLAPHQAIEVEGLVVQAARLANGATIRVEKRATPVEYLQPELDARGILLAEGVPATGGAAGAPADSAVEKCKRRLRERALELGHRLTRDPILHLLADGEMMHPIEIKDGCYSFLISRQTGQVRLRSRASIASEVLPVSDSRRLGVAIRQIVLHGVANVLVLLPGGSKEPPGFYPAEEDEGGVRRWTSGDALLPQSCLTAVGTPCRLEVHLAGTVPYWVPPPANRLVA